MNNPNAIETNGPEIIRQLGAFEIVFDVELSSRNLGLVHAFRICSEIDFIDNRSLVESAIQKWKQLNPLMCSQILTVPQADLRGKYFVRADKSKLDSFDNLKMFELRGSSHSTRSNDDYWQIYYEYEVNKLPVDAANGLMWRITFIKTDKIQENSFTYWVIFSVHHATVDGRSAFVLIQELIEIIEDLNDGRFKPKEPKRIEPSIEAKTIDMKDEKPRDMDRILAANKSISMYKKIPVCFRTVDGPSEHNETTVEGEFVSDRGDELFKLSDLIKMRQLDFATKLKVFVLEPRVFDRLMSKCQSMQVKLTSCLNVIAAVATREVCLNLVPDDLACHKSIQYQIAVNLRSFMQPPLDNHASGCWAVVLMSSLNGSDLNLTDFWHTAKAESDCLHERLRNNEHFEAVKNGGFIFDQIKANAPLSERDCCHFALSNLGKMEMREAHTIRIREHHFGVSIAEDRALMMILHGVTTLEGKLCWSMTYNSRGMKEEIVDNLTRTLIDIIHKII
jgi:hypothetical protein